jgi:clan AA aspartic protease (TIGR02281 family)
MRRVTTGGALLLILVATAGAAVTDLNEAGKAAYLRGDYAAAERLFSQAVARSPVVPEFHYHRAVALTQLGRWREAVEEHEATLRLGPDPALARAVREALRTLVPLTRPSGHVRGDSEDMTVPLERVAGGWVAEVWVNDARQGRFLVDTGAGITVLSPDLAAALGIEPGRDAPSVALRTLAGDTSAPAVSVTSLRIGDAEAKDVPAVIHAIDLRLDGILGNTFLSRYTVTLDSARSVLILRRR